MSTNLAEIWRDAVIHPGRLGDHIRADPKAMVLVLPSCAGVLQSFLQGATNSVGANGSVLMVFMFAVPIGVVWGLLQIHLLSGCLWAVARKDQQRLPFRAVRQVWSLAMAPAATAFLAWVTAAILIGPPVFIDPEAWGPGVFPGASLTIIMLYFGSALAILWGFVVLAFGVREVTGSSMAASVWTIFKSGLVLFGVSLVVVTVLVVGWMVS